MSLTTTLLRPLALLVAANALANPATAQIQWAEDLASAHAEAQTSGKPMLLHFYGDNCVWCDRLEEGAFSTQRVASAIDQGFVAVKIHAGEQPQVASMFRVRQWPTDVVVTPAGQVLSHGVSPQKPGDYVAMLADSAAKLPAAATPVAQPPAPSRPIPETKLAASRTASAGVDATLTGARTDAMSFGEPVTSPRDQLAAATNSAALESATQQTTPTPDLVMNGYCAVSIIEDSEWVEGNPQFGVIHLGQLYLFASEAKLQTFMTDPAPYTPMLGGIDVIRFFEEKRIVQGQREFGMFEPVSKRIYLFADEDAMVHFRENFQGYTGAAQEVMDRAIQDANPGS